MVQVPLKPRGYLFVAGQRTRSQTMEIGTKVRTAIEAGRNPEAGISLANIARKMVMTSLNVTGCKTRRSGKIILRKKRRATAKPPLLPSIKIMMGMF
jgi:hypothetical protein